MPDDLKTPYNYWNIILFSIMGTIKNIFWRKIVARERLWIYINNNNNN